MHRTTLKGLHSRSWLGHSDVRVAASPRNVKRLKYAEFGQAGSLKIDDPAIISLKGDGSDLWRLDSVVDHLRRGGVGIIPTDTLPALVVDLENKCAPLLSSTVHWLPRGSPSASSPMQQLLLFLLGHRNAVMKLYRAKELDPKKPLSILCKSFQEVAYYTLGFPAANTPGQQNWFPVFKRVLPGPYTIILPASKNLPGQCVDFMKGKTIHRKSVGIRMPDDAVCKAVLEGLGRPLLCTSVHVADVLAPDTEVPDSGSMYEAYAGKGIDFIVDIGRRVATQSTVVDMTGAEPVVTRLGRGDPSPFQ